jgi:spermidine synthase
MQVLALYAVVSISGAAVLAIEILGTRVLGPFYGVSLFLWSALITVTLAALAIGYALGGRWADRGPRLKRMGLLLAGAGAWILLVPWVKQPLLQALEPLGLRAAVLSAATVLFAPPLLLLGMVSPYAVRLKAVRLEAVGRTAGNLFSISTLASVISALCTGFYLIPLLGVAHLLLLVGLLLLAGAALAFAVDGRASMLLACLALLSASTFFAWFATSPGADPERGLLVVEHSPYAEIRVLERDEVRYLLLDGGVHTAIDPSTGISLHPYVAVVGLARHFFPEPGRLLLVGLGGGAIVRDFVQAGWSVDAVEIDAVVIEAAQRHFGLHTDACRIVCMDGRRYLRETKQRYDLIVLDAFGSSAIPFHLVTREMFALVAQRLSSRGLLAVNVETRAWDDILLRAIAASVQTALPSVLALPTSEPPNSLGNVVLLAGRDSLQLAEDAIPRPQAVSGDPRRLWLVQKQNHAWDNRYRPDTKGVPVLTDDRNPVNLWAERVNRVARSNLHEFFGDDGLSW